MNNIYAMYVMLYEFLISILLLFKSTYKKAEKPKMRKFSGRGDVMSISFPKGKARHAHSSKGRGKTLASLNKTQQVQRMFVRIKNEVKHNACPTHGLGNA